MPRLRTQRQILCLRKPGRKSDRLRVECLERRCLMNAGDLDLSFDTDGLLTTPIGSGTDEGRAVAIQPDGKIVVAGRSSNGSNYDFALARYNADGTLDTSFDGDGKVTTAIGTSNDEVYAIAIQPDGKIIVAGRASISGNYDFALVRYNSDGTLDTSFDTDGKVTTPISGNNTDEAYALAIQSDGKIVAAGRSRQSNYDFAVVRYNADGSLDTTFDSDGKVTTSIGGIDEAKAVVIQPDGKIVAAGRARMSNDDFALVRYNTNGSLDSTFDSDGKVTTAVGASTDEAYALVLQSDGKLVAAGRSSVSGQYDFGLARYNTNGSLDTTFDSDGKVTTAVGTSTDEAYALRQQTDGKLVAAGRSSVSGQYDLSLIRYNTSGSLDTGFSGDGKVTTSIGSGADEVYALAIQSDRMIVAAGRSMGSTYDFALARYQGNTAPVAVADSYSVNEDASLVATAPGVVGNDSDADGDPLTAILVTGPSNGTLTINANGSFTYTPNANYSGADSFTYKASDGLTDSNVVTVTLTVDPINDAPVSVAEAFSVNEDNTLSVSAPGVLGNDSDVDGDPLTAFLISGTTNGTLTLNANGSFSYTPNANYNGSDSFSYRATDGSLNSEVVTVSITVAAVNDVPVAAADSYSVTEDNSLAIAAAGVLANDGDVEGSLLTAAVVAGPANGVLTLNADGSFSYSPNANFNGSDSFTYKANDGAADSNVATITITVNAVNDAPVAVANSYSFNEDTSLLVTAPGVLGNDSDADADPLTASLVSGPSFGTLAFNADGSFTYSPNANYSGSDSFQYQVFDGTDNSGIVVVSLTVNPVNDVPIAFGDAYTTFEDATLNVPTAGVLANDSDAEGSPLTAILVSGPVHGTLTLNANGSFSFVPTAQYNGPDSFTYKANDGSTDSAVATVSISIGPVNDAPVAVGDSYSVNEDATLTVAASGVLGNDTDIEGDPLTALLVVGPANGTLTLNANGSFTYVPNANFNGADSFLYQANDAQANSNVAVVSITVAAVNDPPAAVADFYGVTEDGALTVAAAGVLANDSDVEGSPLTAILVTGPTNGTLTLNGDGSFTYTPNANFGGLDSFTYKANDGAADSGTATVTITVSAVNDAPVAAADSHSVNEDATLSVSAAGVLANDTDVEVDPLTAILVVGPANGTVTLNADGSFSYTPVANYNGPDLFTYQANDGNLNSNVATVSINVNSVNDAPIAADDSYNLDEDATLNLSAPGVLSSDSDVDGDSLTAVLVAGPTNGTLTLSANGSLSYTPNANFNGSDSFTYRASDGALNSNVATATITVNAVNDAPAAGNETYSVAEDNTLTIVAPGVLANDGDVDADPITAILVSGPANGTVILNADGSFVYVPNADFNGADSFAYQASDGPLGSNVATVTITVDAVNDAPNVVDDSWGVNENTTLTVFVPGVLAGDSDVDGDPITAILVAGPTNGTLSLNANGSFSYVPNINYSGPDSFTYKANDGFVDSTPATVSITVHSVNVAPVAADDAYNGNEDATLVVAGPGVLGNDSDGDNDALVAILVTGPVNGSLTLNVDGSFTYTPNANFNGVDSFTYKANDGVADSNIATVSISLSAASDVPVAIPDSYAVNEDATLTVAAPGVLGNDIEVDGDSLTGVLVTGPSSGTLTLNANGSFSYTPNANFNGSDSFTYKANDGATDSNVVAVAITVVAVNDAPVAAGDSYSVNEDATLTVATPGVLGNDSDVDGNPLTAVLVTGPSSGTLTLNANGSFSYTPNANFNGSDSFTYKANDGATDSDEATVTITVGAINDAPALTAPGAQTVAEGAVLTFTVSATDIDGGLLSFSASGLPAGATFSAATRTFSWTPGFTDAGSYTVSFAVSDDNGASETKAVSITVTNSNRSPTAAAGPDQSVEGVIAVGGTVALAGSGSDPDGDPLTYAWREGSSLLSTQAAPALNLSYGSHTLTLTVTDSSGASAADSMTVVVADTTGPMITDLTFLAVKKTITGLVLKASESLNPATAGNLSNYALHSAGKDKKLGTADDLALPLASTAYNAVARTIELTPAKALKAGQFFKLSVLDNGDITDLAGNRLDGDMDGGSGGDCIALVARGTKIKYTDSNGDVVSLSLKNGGTMEMVRRLDGEGSHLRLADLVSGTSALSAKVKASSLGGDGLTRLDLFSGAGSIADSIANLPIQIENTLTAAVDLLLANGI